MKLNRWLGLAALAASTQFLPAADIVGKVTLKGNPPPERELPVNDGFCGPGTKAKVMKTRLYTVGAGGELADVVVYLKDGVTGATIPVPAAANIIDQIGCEYIPYVSAAQVGQKITVKNSDNTMHNVHPQPMVPGNPEQNLVQMPKAKDLDFVYKNPEQFIKFKCDVHNWMFAYVSVVPHPYFAVTGKDGSFVIKNVPKGNYTVEASHRKAKAEQKVTVADADAKADFVLNVPAAP